LIFNWSQVSPISLGVTFKSLAILKAAGQGSLPSTRASRILFSSSTFIVLPSLTFIFNSSIFTIFCAVLIHAKISLMKVCLHICCAVCAAGAAERLIQEGHQVVGFYYNPNIFPPEEYQLRLENARQVARELHFPLHEGRYEPAVWETLVSGLENEPEGGRRCPLCFKMRLEKTYRFMLESNCESFASTLSMGSNKPAPLIEQLAAEVGGATFLSRDFKKKEGFKRAGELAKQWGLYRQNYCGCRYSLRDRAIRGHQTK
jgi:epoxyqueuosine reductase